MSNETMNSSFACPDVSFTEEDIDADLQEIAAFAVSSFITDVRKAVAAGEHFHVEIPAPICEGENVTTSTSPLLKRKGSSSSSSSSSSPLVDVKAFQAVANDVMRSVLQQEADDLQHAPWFYGAAPAASSVHTISSRAEFDAREKARSRLVELLGPRLGATPATIGQSHIPKPLRIHRAKIMDERERAGPAGYNLPSSTKEVELLRPRPSSLGYKTSLLFSQVPRFGQQQHPTNKDDNNSNSHTPKQQKEKTKMKKENGGGGSPGLSNSSSNNTKPKGHNSHEGTTKGEENVSTISLNKYTGKENKSRPPPASSPEKLDDNEALAIERRDYATIAAAAASVAPDQMHTSIMSLADLASPPLTLHDQAPKRSVTRSTNEKGNYFSNEHDDDDDDGVTVASTASSSATDDDYDEGNNDNKKNEKNDDGWDDENISIAEDMILESMNAGNMFYILENEGDDYDYNDDDDNATRKQNEEDEKDDEDTKSVKSAPGRMSKRNDMDVHSKPFTRGVTNGGKRAEKEDSKMDTDNGAEGKVNENEDSEMKEREEEDSNWENVEVVWIPGVFSVPSSSSSTSTITPTSSIPIPENQLSSTEGAKHHAKRASSAPARPRGGGDPNSSTLTSATTTRTNSYFAAITTSKQTTSFSIPGTSTNPRYASWAKQEASKLRQKAREQFYGNAHMARERSLAIRKQQPLLITAEDLLQRRSSHRGYTIAPLQEAHASLSDAEWFRLCLTRARQRRSMRGKGAKEAEESFDLLKSLKVVEKRPHGGLQFGAPGHLHNTKNSMMQKQSNRPRRTSSAHSLPSNGEGKPEEEEEEEEEEGQERTQKKKKQNANHASTTTTPTDSHARARYHRLLHDMIVALHRQDAQTAITAQLQAEGRTADPINADPFIRRTISRRGRQPTLWTPAMAVETSAAKVKRMSEQRRGYVTQSVWYASQLHQAYTFKDGTQEAEEVHSGEGGKRRSSRSRSTSKIAPDQLHSTSSPSHHVAQSSSAASAAAQNIVMLRGVRDNQASASTLLQNDDEDNTNNIDDLSVPFSSSFSQKAKSISTGDEIRSEKFSTTLPPINDRRIPLAAHVGLTRGRDTIKIIPRNSGSGGHRIVVIPFSKDPATLPPSVAAVVSGASGPGPQQYKSEDPELMYKFGRHRRAPTIRIGATTGRAEHALYGQVGDGGGNGGGAGNDLQFSASVEGAIGAGGMGVGVFGDGYTGNGGGNGSRSARPGDVLQLDPSKAYDRPSQPKYLPAFTFGRAESGRILPSSEEADWGVLATNAYEEEVSAGISQKNGGKEYDLVQADMVAQRVRRVQKVLALDATTMHTSQVRANATDKAIRESFAVAKGLQTITAATTSSTTTTTTSIGFDLGDDNDGSVSGSSLRYRRGGTTTSSSSGHLLPSVSSPAATAFSSSGSSQHHNNIHTQNDWESALEHNLAGLNLDGILQQPTHNSSSSLSSASINHRSQSKPRSRPKAAGKERSTSLRTGNGGGVGAGAGGGYTLGPFPFSSSSSSSSSLSHPSLHSERSINIPSRYTTTTTSSSSGSTDAMIPFSEGGNGSMTNSLYSSSAMEAVSKAKPNPLSAAATAIPTTTKSKGNAK